jgi:acyl-CoA synthetase (AMP-forming)/AMP-acid ligase II
MKERRTWSNHASPGDKYESERKSMLYHEYFQRQVQRDPHKVAVVVGDRRATYAQLDQMATWVAGALSSRGIGAGDRVAIYVETTVEAIAALFGILRIGAAVVTVHHTFGLKKLHFQLRESGAKALVTSLPDRLDEVLDEVPLPLVIHTSRDHAATSPSVLPFNAPIDGGAAGYAACVPNPDSLGAIFYTSGSTSDPKGVAVTHRSMVAAFESVTGYLRNTVDDNVLSFTALGSDYGFYNITMPLLFGGRAIVEKSIPADAARILDVIERECVTALHVFPPAVFLLAGLQSSQLRAVPSLRYLSSSGQPLPVEYTRRLRAAFPNMRIFSSYGLTECKRVSYLEPDEIDRRPSSVGKPIPGVEAFLVSDSGMLIDEPGEEGELAVGGELVMQGYWNKSELTQRVLRRGVFGSDRVFFTGDIFKRDADGFLYFVSRKDEVFARNLFKVNPREIEQVLLAHEAVAEAVVIPVPDEVAGNVPKACVVVRDGHVATADELIRHCAARLDWHMVPTVVAFHDSFHRTESGKTARRGLD